MNKNFKTAYDILNKRRKKIRKLKRKKPKKIKRIKSHTTNELIFKVPKKWSKSAYADKSQYEKKYKLSIKDNEGFWRKEGKRIDWIKPYTKIKDVKYSKTNVRIKWFYDGILNASANCLEVPPLGTTLGDFHLISLAPIFFIALVNPFNCSFFSKAFASL